MTWRLQAACWDTDSQLFVNTDPGYQSGKRAKIAKAICGPCPVVRDCLDYAQDLKLQHGIWGGLTVKERLALRKVSA